VSSWDDADDTEELRPLKPFRPHIPRAGHDGDRPRPRRPADEPRDPDGPRGPVYGGGGGGPRGPQRSDDPHGDEPEGFTPSRQVVIGGVAVVVVLLLILLVSSCGSSKDEANAEQELVDRYLAAYAQRDYESMFADIDTDAQRVNPVKRFAALHRDAYRLATGESIQVGAATRDGRQYTAPVSIRTTLFGTIESELRLRVIGTGGDTKIAWSRSMAFPGLRTGERLTRDAQIPRRGTILFRDGATAIAKGESRSSTAPAAVIRSIRGDLGAIPEADRKSYTDRGIPADTKIGKSGLERLLNDQLIGRPGLTLKAGDRVIARQKAMQARNVISSISLPAMEAAVRAQASAPSGGGLIAFDTKTGEVLAFAGDAWTDPRAPGSTMKIITAAAALTENTTTPDTDYPPLTSALGIQNADGASCGGSFVEAFAKSCNSVFAPLAIEVGSSPFVRMAEAFGFNADPAVPGGDESTIPDDLDDGDLALSGIGQAKVLATPLQVAMMAATVATGGDQPRLTFRQTTKEAPTKKVIETDVAADLLTMMEAVVSEGTGTSASIPGVDVAGKTGTAEVRTTQGPACRDGSAVNDFDSDTGAGTTTDDGASIDGAGYDLRRGRVLRPAAATLAQAPDGGTDPDDFDDPTTTEDEDPTTTTETTTTEDTVPTDPIDPLPATPATPDDGAPSICDPSDSTDTDAWMAAFAPADGIDRAPVAIGVLRRGDGQGGDTAAPVARAVLQALLPR
jgi:hypothetical protein